MATRVEKHAEKPKPDECAHADPMIVVMLTPKFDAMLKQMLVCVYTTPNDCGHAKSNACSHPNPNACGHA